MIMKSATQKQKIAHQKKTYCIPKLTVFGSITELTRVNARGPANDGSGDPHSHKVPVS